MILCGQKVNSNISTPGQIIFTAKKAHDFRRKKSSVMCFLFIKSISLLLPSSGTSPGSRNTGYIFYNRTQALYFFHSGNLLPFPEPDSSGRRFHSGHTYPVLYKASSEKYLKLLPFLSRYSCAPLCDQHEIHDFHISLQPLPWKSLPPELPV